MKTKTLIIICILLIVSSAFSLNFICGKMELLLTDKHEWDDYNSNWDPIHKAAYKGDIKKITKLLDKGVYVDAIDQESGLTVLETAIMAQKYDAVMTLLENGADVNLMNPEVDGLTPLMTACLYDNVEIVKLLLDYGAKINTCNKSGWTALKSSISEGSEDILKVLISQHADINFQHEIFDETALMLAIYGGEYKKVKILIEEGADKTIETKHGETAQTFNEIYNKKDNLEIYKAIFEILSE